MKKVLLIGDSIRLSYGARVKELLADWAEVTNPGMNNQWTTNAMWQLPGIVADAGVSHFDVIHWNTGIWDLHRHMVDGNFTLYDDYLWANERLYRQMAHYGSRLIWATITPGGKQLDETRGVFDNTGTGAYMLVDYQDKWNADVLKYNAGAVDLYRSHGVAINDLCTPLLADTDRYICGDGIHLTPEGVELAAQMTADSIRTQLIESEKGTKV